MAMYISLYYMIVGPLWFLMAVLPFVLHYKGVLSQRSTVTLFCALLLGVVSVSKGLTVCFSIMALRRVHNIALLVCMCSASFHHFQWWTF